MTIHKYYNRKINLIFDRIIKKVSEPRKNTSLDIQPVGEDPALYFSGFTSLKSIFGLTPGKMTRGSWKLPSADTQPITVFCFLESHAKL